jgi:hypothetical protein
MVGLVLTLLLHDTAPFLPDWKPGQEYVYRGSVKEMGPVEDWQVIQSYSLELRLLVSKVTTGSAELYCCTKLTQTTTGSVSVHLAQAMVDARGHITSCSVPTGKTLLLDGPATWETGFLLPLPEEKVVPNIPWEAREPGRQPRLFTWLSNSGDLMVKGLQESIDWQRPRGDSTAWRRSDQLTFSSRATLPIKVERLVERRAPAFRRPTTRFITEYTLQNVETLAGPMLDARLLDIENIMLFQADVQTLSKLPLDKASRAAWVKLESRLEDYQAAAGNTPYRETLTTLRSTIQAALENRLPQVQHQVTERSIEPGQLLPPFTLTTTTGEVVNMAQLKGRPTLLVFYRPGSQLTKTLETELPAWQRAHGQVTFHCLFLASREGEEPLLPAATGARLLAVPGRSLMGIFNVVDTPHFVLLDCDGALLSTITGYSPATRRDLDTLLRKELAKVR